MTVVDIDFIKFLQVIFLLLALEIVSTCFSSRSRSQISTSQLFSEDHPSPISRNPLDPPWFRLGVFNIRGKGRDKIEMALVSGFEDVQYPQDMGR